MTDFSEFVQMLPDYLGIFILMLSTFLVGYLSASWFQGNRFRKKIKRLKKEVNSLRKPEKDPRDIETIFTEIKPKIMEVVMEAREAEEEEQLLESVPSIEELRARVEEELTDEEEVSQEAIAQRARTTYISYNIEKPELDFDSFGYADGDNRDDLTRIMGIGPYIEQKLNDIGICTYDQISRLKDSDIKVITELIDFFPGRIERDNWVGQAKALKVK